MKTVSLVEPQTGNSVPVALNHCMMPIILGFKTSLLIPYCMLVNSMELHPMLTLKYIINGVINQTLRLVLYL